jgi:hypothetical protein
MADDATPTTTPADDGLARVNPDGTVDTGGRRAFVWCEDEVTRHRFDVPSRVLPKSGIKVIEGYPLNFKRAGRTGKTRLQLVADPAETDVHGDVGESGAPESTTSGDAVQAAQAAATQPVEERAPEGVPSGDVQQQETAAAAPDLADGVPVEASEPESDGDDAAAKRNTTRTRRNPA